MTLPVPFANHEHIAAGATRVLLLRHGQTDGNALQRFVGVTDVPLNERGREQAHLLGAHLAHAHTLDALYASPLARAQETAHIIKSKLAQSASIQTEPDLIEMNFGEAEDVPIAELGTRFPAVAPYIGGAKPGDPDWQFPGGDFRVAYYTRAVGVVGRLAARHPGQTVAMVTHGGVIIGYLHWLRRQVLGYSPEFNIDNCSISEIIVNAGGAHIARYGDVRHLQEVNHAIHAPDAR
jgi:broad specificity phosphatase PhoE